MDNKLPTIKEIANRLNVSVSTVSRALHNHPSIGLRTKMQVQQLAKELNYEPNQKAIFFKQGETFTIGVILPNLREEYFSIAINGIEDVAIKNKYNVIISQSHDDPEREKQIVDTMRKSRVDGIVVSIAKNTINFDHFLQLENFNIPVVFFDRVPADIKTSKVMQDDYHGAFEAVRHLITNGYRRIAHISATKELTITQKRLQGYIDALQKHNLPIREEWIIYSGFSQESGEKDTYELLKCKIKPDAIFALNDRKAVGVMVALKNKKITIGKQMGVIGFADDPVASVITPTLTTISVPAVDIGKISCELLFKHIKKKNFSPQETTLPCELIVRESTIKK